MASVAKVELVALCNVIVIGLQGKEKTFCIEVQETQRDCRCGYYNAKSDHFYVVLIEYFDIVFFIGKDERWLKMSFYRQMT